MKQEENNEIDTLLRNLARRQQGVDYQPDSASREFAARGAHLDVDELSSYAERALPPSARARCTAHLADCDDCRKIVAQLSLAVGPLTDERKIEPEPVVGLTWTQKISTLFSPRIIRYAMPALAMVIVAVAFFGWRQQRVQRVNDQVAVKGRSEPATATKAGAEPVAVNKEPVASKNKAFSDLAAERDQKEAQKEAKAQPTSAPTARAEGAKAEGQSSDEKKAEGSAGGSIAPSKAAKQDAPAADKAAEGQAAYAPEPAVPPAKPQSVAVTREQKDLAKNNSNNDGMDRGKDANAQRQGPARNENEVAQRGPAKSQSQAAPKFKVSESASAAGARADDDEAETRAVSGRRFRRISGAWVDTAYKSSMSLRNVTRDTEEYRALIADEPVIGNIGKQLSGEVIVVWKGHAYHIN